jgi:hypothetical protein
MLMMMCFCQMEGKSRFKLGGEGGNFSRRQAQKNILIVASSDPYLLLPRPQHQRHSKNYVSQYCEENIGKI